MQHFCLLLTHTSSQNLMDTKIALDMEIAVFRRLLESEEDRLGIAGPDALGKNRLFYIVTGNKIIISQYL